MKTRKNLPALIFVFFFCFSLIDAEAQLQINSNVDPEEMVEFLIGPGINFNNVQHFGANGARGIFTNGDSTNIGLESGIFLCSGIGINIPGPNSSPSIGTNNGVPGDTLLTSIVGATTYDASVLEFDFTPAADTAWCNFVFGSEEYHEWVNSAFNDVFGFFVTGPKPDSGFYVSKNVALVPGTEIPVAINNVNNGYAPPGIPSGGPCQNCEYFVDNYNGLTIEYDGFTVVLKAKIPVIPGEDYHFKLAVADVGDHIYDSGVLLEGNSFKSQGAAEFLSFNFLAEDNPGLIEDIIGEIIDNTVSLLVPEGTDVTGLIASFETQGGVIVKIDSIVQQSSVTPNDFTQPVIYNLDGININEWTVNVDILSSIDNIELKKVKIYPNPAIGKFELRNIKNFKIYIYNSFGRLVKGYKNPVQGSSLVITDLPPGIYFVKIEKNDISNTRKVIVY